MKLKVSKPIGKESAKMKVKKNVPSPLKEKAKKNEISRLKDNIKKNAASQLENKVKKNEIPPVKNDKKNKNRKNDKSKMDILPGAAAEISKTLKVKSVGKKDEELTKAKVIEATPVISDSKPDVDDATILKAIDAVKSLNLAAKKSKDKSELFDDEDSFLLQVDCIKIAKCPTRKLRFHLPHWMVTDTSDICMFVSDLQRGSRVDHEPTVQHYEDMFREKGITNIKAIIPVRQVRVEFDQMEMRRRLMTQYDFFLADSKVSGLLAHKLGKIFFEKNNLPTPVKFDRKDLKAEIDRALHKTVMKIHGKGNTFVARVAHDKHKPNEVCENIQAMLLQIAEQFPGGWSNIRAVYLKYSRSMAIPIYLTLKNKNTVKQAVIKSLRPKDAQVTGELSTVLGGFVTVHRDGKVTMKVNKEEQSDDEATPAKKPKLPENKKAPKKTQAAVPTEKDMGNSQSISENSDDQSEDESDSRDEKSEDDSKSELVENGVDESEDDDDDDDDNNDNDEEDDDDDDNESDDDDDDDEDDDDDSE